MPCPMNPATRSTWVRQRDDDRPASFYLDRVLLSHRFVEGKLVEKVIDGQAANGNDESWANDSYLRRQPITTASPLHRRRHTIASAARVRARVTPGDRGDIQ